MKNYTCPHCKVKQTEIGLTSEADQTVNLKTGEYETIDQIGDSLYCFCLNCGEVLPKKYLKVLP